jgi:high mobility group protein B2
MSEGANINLAPEFRKHPDRAKWLVEKVFPAMKQHFEEFDVNVILGALTNESMDIKRIKGLYNSQQRKQQKFQADGVKKARTAYFFFCDEKREELKGENESLSFGAVNQKLGDMWAQLSPAAKKPYETKAEKDKARFAKEYNSAKSGAIERGEFKENPMKSIKKPRTSYLCFSTDEAVRKKHAKKANDNKELMKILGEVWKGMSEKERKPYVDEAEQDKQRYMKEKSTMEKKLEKEGKVSHPKSDAEHSGDESHGNESGAEHSDSEPKQKKQKTSTKSVKAEAEPKAESKPAKKSAPAPAPAKQSKASKPSESGSKKSSGSGKKSKKPSSDDEDAGEQSE